MLALEVGLLASFAVYRNQYAATLGLWILNRILDGLVARLRNKQYASQFIWVEMRINIVLLGYLFLPKLIQLFKKK